MKDHLIVHCIAEVGNGTQFTRLARLEGTYYAHIIYTQKSNLIQIQCARTCHLPLLLSSKLER